MKNSGTARFILSDSLTVYVKIEHDPEAGERGKFGILREPTSEAVVFVTDSEEGVSYPVAQVAIREYPSNSEAGYQFGLKTQTLRDALWRCWNTAANLHDMARYIVRELSRGEFFRPTPAHEPLSDFINSDVYFKTLDVQPQSERAYIRSVLRIEQMKADAEINRLKREIAEMRRMLANEQKRAERLENIMPHDATCDLCPNIADHEGADGGRICDVCRDGEQGDW